MKLKYRIGLDLGANSLGWCLFELNANGEPIRIVRMGSRIFSDGRSPKNLASLAATRRAARQARRRRDRVVKRRHRLMEGLIRFGLMPTDEDKQKGLQTLDPYALRAKGLDHALTPHEFGRALYHLTRKRGFKSSRKDRTDAEREKETGKVKAAIIALRECIETAHCRTVGEYLARLHADRQPVRARRSKDGEYVLYLQRSMVEEEFDRLWVAQQAHHPDLLTDTARDYLKDALLFQRRLLPVRPGRCLFESDEYRAPLCSPLQQRFRILQELNNLRLTDGVGTRPLTLQEREILLQVLLHTPGQVTFPKLAEAIGFGRRSVTRFNLESEKRKGLKGDATAQFAASDTLGAEWFALESDIREGLALLVERVDQDALLQKALLELPGNLSEARFAMRPFPHEESLLAALGRLPATLTPQQARAIAQIRLPEDFGNLSRKALARIVPELEREVVTYDIAVKRAGYDHHSQFYQGEFFPRLPYYGQILRGYTSPADKAKDKDECAFGKIPNPTVHIGLNQLRQLMNALIARYGHPHEIVIELTREFGLSGERRRELEAEQAQNQQRNQALDQRLHDLGQPKSYINRLKLRLWDELGSEDPLMRQCIYSGAAFSVASLFSDEIEIDHILPFSKSLHDGVGNKLLCTRQANRDKGNRTPFEAFGHSPGRYRWEEVEERVKRLFASSKNPALRRKAAYFEKDALKTFLGDKDFLARHLTDTAYLSRAAKRYLSAICPQNFVWNSSGKLTGMLRGKWGLPDLLWANGKKNREDHRHHALDAAVIGLCDRSLIQRLSNSAQHAEEHGENRLLESLQLPWPGFRDELKTSLERIVVSHKPDHGKEASLHNDTNYGWRGDPDNRGNPLVGRRKPLEEIKSAREAQSIASERLRTEIVQLLAPLSSGKETKSALRNYSERTGIRHVICEERLSVIPIRDRRSKKPYRYVKGDGNFCYEIFRKADGRWDGEVISSFEANQPNFVASRNQAQNGLPLVMRIHGGDVLTIEVEEKAKLMRVARISEGIISLVEPHEANVDARARDKSSGFKYFFKSPSALRPLRARLVGVNILGYVNDPGFRE